MERNTEEDAQLLWQREKHQIHETLRKQKEQMMEDKKWLKKEERLLVGNRASFTFVNPLFVSLSSSGSECSVAVKATWNEAPLNNTNLLVHPKSPTSLKLNVPLITVPKRGSISLLYEMNLPVSFQDPMGLEDTANPEVGVLLYRV